MLARADTHTGARTVRDTWARLSPGTAAASGACGHTCPATGARRAGPSLLLARLRLACSFPRLLVSRALVRLPPPGTASRRCPEPVTPGGRATHAHERGAAAGGGGGTAGAAGPGALAVACSAAAAAAASGWAGLPCSASPPPPFPGRDLWLPPGRARPCPAPPRAPQRPALLSPGDLAAGGGRRAILTHAPNGDSAAGKDGWAQGEPPESDRKPWHSYTGNTANSDNRWYSR